jgi:ADP-heptose:LPS heptosyltransferase
MGMTGSASGPGRVLVFSMAGIGDTLMATPVLRELRGQWPGARIEVVVMWPGSAQLLEGNPHVDAVHAFNLIERPRAEGLRFVMGLRRPRADVSLTLHPQGRREYRWVAWLAGARRRLSHRYENQGWLDRCLVTDGVEQDYSVSCAENNLRLVDLMGGRRREARPRYELFLSDSEQAWARDWCHEEGLEGTPWLGIHVGSGGTKNLALRRWPVERWAAFLRDWREARPGVPVVAFGGPGERGAHESLARVLPPGCVRFPAAPSLRAAAALVGRARDNAARNGIANVEFFVADLFKDVAGLPWARRRYDRVLLDPPRAGAKEVLPLVAGSGAQRVVYISCHSGSLARDAGLLVREHGFRLTATGVMDMFPHTTHVEAMAVFDR